MTIIQFPNANRPWRKPDLARLLDRFTAGASIEDLAQEFGRKPSAIRNKLSKLGMFKARWREKMDRCFPSFLNIRAFFRNAIPR